MLCLHCKNEEFTAKRLTVPQEFRGQEFNVDAHAMVCTKCGWTTVTDDQADELAGITAEEYRKRNGLLTSEEIRAIRAARNESQRQFAKFLGVGEASVKRWETGYVQDKAHDELIRLKCALSSAPRESTVAASHIRLHNFTVERVTAASPHPWPMRSQTTGAVYFSTTAHSTQMRIELSDGNPWRQSHFSAHDPALAATA